MPLNPPEKKFDPVKHRYYFDGVRIPGATDVLKAAGMIEDRWFTESSRWNGSVVHKYIELYNKKQLDWDAIELGARGYLRSYEKFLWQTNFKIRGIEKPLMTKYFGCTPDLWGRLNEKATVIEIKSGPVPDWAAFQCCLQSDALNECEEFFPSQKIGLQLMQDGDIARVTPFTDFSDEAMARGLLSEWWWKFNHGYFPNWTKED